MQMLERSDLPSGGDGQRAHDRRGSYGHLDSCRGRNLRQSTIDSYTKTFSYVDGTVPLEMADNTFLEGHRKKREIAANTWRKELEHLRASGSERCHRAENYDGTTLRLQRSNRQWTFL